MLPLLSMLYTLACECAFLYFRVNMFLCLPMRLMPSPACYTSGMKYEFPKSPEFPYPPPDEPEGRYLVPVKLKK